MTTNLLSVVIHAVIHDMRVALHESYLEAWAAASRPVRSCPQDEGMEAAIAFATNL